MHWQQSPAYPLGAIRLMPRVSFTRHLQTFFPKLKMGEDVPGTSVREVVAELERRYP
jgi:hypothetical protein